MVLKQADFNCYSSIVYEKSPAGGGKAFILMLQKVP